MKTPIWYMKLDHLQPQGTARDSLTRRLLRQESCVCQKLPRYL